MNNITDKTDEQQEFSYIENTYCFCFVKILDFHE